MNKRCLSTLLAFCLLAGEIAPAAAAVRAAVSAPAPSFSLGAAAAGTSGSRLGTASPSLSLPAVAGFSLNAPQITAPPDLRPAAVLNNRAGVSGAPANAGLGAVSERSGFGARAVLSGGSEAVSAQASSPRSAVSSLQGGGLPEARLQSKNPVTGEINLGGPRAFVQSGGVEEDEYRALDVLRDTGKRVSKGEPAAALDKVYDARGAFDRAGAEAAVDASDARQVYGNFLRRLGFASYGEQVAETLKTGEQDKDQKLVLNLAADRLAVVESARELAVAVMAAVERREDRLPALAKAIDLAARLIELRPLDAPERLPYEVEGMKRPDRLKWLIAVSERRAARQAERVLSDVVGAIYTQSELDEAFAGRSPAVAAEIERLNAHVRTVLRSMYADVEMSGGRFAGRALTASLVRYAKVHQQAAVEDVLSQAFARKGFRLSDYVGNTFTLTDNKGATKTIDIRTGDILGTRSRSRRSSEIAIGAVPHPLRWWRAWREGLFGSIFGVWMKPMAKYPLQIPGQPLRNWLRRMVFNLRKSLANTPYFLKGYSHVGIADVREADGVYNVLVWENEVDVGEGGIRPVSFWDQFLVKDYHARIGVARMDDVKMWEAFHAQAENRGFVAHPHQGSGGGWRSILTPAEYQELLAIPKDKAPDLASILHRRAVRLIEGLMTGFGIGYGYGLADTLLRLVCTSTIWHGYMVGSQFEIQSRRDMFHPLTYLLRWLGFKNTAGLNMKARVIWPGSFFADEKVATHQKVNLAGRDGGRRIDDHQTMPSYREKDELLTSELSALMESRGVSSSDPMLGSVLRRHMLVRRWRRRDPNSRRSSVSLPRGYAKDVEILYDR